MNEKYARAHTISTVEYAVIEQVAKITQFVVIGLKIAAMIQVLQGNRQNTTHIAKTWAKHFDAVFQTPTLTCSSFLVHSFAV